MLQMDYHIHCLNSPDSSEPLERICERGIELGLKEIMVTDHYEMFTDGFDREPFQKEYLDGCAETVERCRKRYGSQLFVGFGIELGQCHLQEAAARRVLREYPFDYVIASYHKIRNKDLMMFDYRKTDCRELCRTYLTGLLEIAETGDYDCMGHLDLIKRYAAAQGVSVCMEEEEKLVRQILRTVISRGKGLEINTSGLRQSVNETFPSRTILTWYREEGGQIITVGSDAHRAEDVAAGVDEAEKLLRELGFFWVARFRKRVMFRSSLCSGMDYRAGATGCEGIQYGEITNK